MEEIWKVIEGYENLQVSNFGRVWNGKTGRYIGSRFKSNRGKLYKRIKVGKKGSVFVHVLVALAFLENPDNKLSVDHIDGNGENNNVSNLRYATAKENGQNRGLNKNNKLKIKGVYIIKNNKYQAGIRVDGKNVYLGTFTYLEDAIKAREKAEDLYFGEFKHQKLNPNVTISNRVDRMII